jgi:hypothetical protein
MFWKLLIIEIMDDWIISIVVTITATLGVITRFNKCLAAERTEGCFFTFYSTLCESENIIAIKPVQVVVGGGFEFVAVLIRTEISTLFTYSEFLATEWTISTGVTIRI